MFGRARIVRTIEKTVCEIWKIIHRVQKDIIQVNYIMFQKCFVNLKNAHFLLISL
jgi:hypothetical protein